MINLPDKPKISLCMIVRDNQDTLGNCLESIHKFVDEIVITDTGSKDDTIEVAKKYGAKISHFEWIADFAAARNYNFSQASHDCVLWLDDDDIVISGESLCDMARAAFSLDMTECWVDYDYMHDRHGGCRLRHLRERFLHHRVYEWRARVHESPCGKYLIAPEKINREFGYIKHTSLIEDELDQNKRTLRNLAIMEDMEKKGELDHRMLYMYANVLFSVGRWQEALAWYRRYTTTMTRSAHHYAALCQSSKCLMLDFKWREARVILCEAVTLYPKYATAYYLMAQTYAVDRAWDQALDWADEALAHQAGAVGELIHDPIDVLTAPHRVRAGALIEMGRMDEAEKELELPLKHMPDSEGVIYFKRVIDATKAKVQAADAYGVLKGNLIAEGRDDDLESLAELAPSVIRYHPEVLKYKRRTRRSDRPSIGIMCPLSLEIWGPDSIKTGIGGSETAVIQMSKELDKFGWDVTVYAHTKDIGTFDGIHWMHFAGYNYRKDFHDVMITWRAPMTPMQLGQNCKVSIFWAHDIFAEANWHLHPELLYDKVFVLSNFHKDLYSKRIADDLLYVTANGTDPALWVEPDNQPHKIIYSSCPSRGLVHILREWSFVLDEVPQAELHCYYGYNKAFEQSVAQMPAARRLYVELEQLRKQKGVNWHGRVSKKELHEAQASSQVWTYPCDFQEISCITAMEAQIHGATPVTSDAAALAETIQYGLKRHYDFNARADQVRYIQCLINELKNPSFKEKEVMVSWARQTFRWETVAQDWHRLFTDLLEHSGSEIRKVEQGSIPKKIYSVVS